MFGECRNGVNMDEHSFDQECNSCLDDEEEDGAGDIQAQNNTDDRGKKRQRTG